MTQRREGDVVSGRGCHDLRERGGAGELRGRGDVVSLLP